MTEPPSPSFFSFQGRLRRRTYALRVLGVGLPVAVFTTVLESSGDPSVAVLASLVLVIGSLSLLPTGVQRLHDMGWTGHWLWLGIIPLVGLIIGLMMLFKGGEAGGNKYGYDPRRPTPSQLPLRPEPLRSTGTERRSVNQRPPVGPHQLSGSGTPPVSTRPESTPVLKWVQMAPVLEAKAVATTPAQGGTLVAKVEQPRPPSPAGPAPLPKAPRIGYDPAAVPERRTSFPMILMPKPGAAVQPPRAGRAGGRGYKERDLHGLLVQHFGERFVVRADCALAVAAGGRAYEPDLVLHDPATHLYIDIEVDEPYGGLTRVPTHCAGTDDVRNVFFTSRGWIVVRFPEILVHQRPDVCCTLIAAVLQRLLPGYSVPPALVPTASASSVGRWDAPQAKRWEQERYRESYLGIRSFGSDGREETAVVEQLTAVEAAFGGAVSTGRASVSPPPWGGIIPAVNGDGGATPAPEVLVVRNSSRKIVPLSEQNYHPRDANLSFDPEGHVYSIGGDPGTVSVTTLIDQSFPTFDSERVAARVATNPRSEYYGRSVADIVLGWETDRDRAAREGTALHEQIEAHLNGDPARPDAPEFGYFLQFLADHPDLEPYRTEWRIYDERLMVAGTVDALFRRADGTLLMIDWKRSKEIKKENRYARGLGCLSHLPDANYYKYALQQNLYREILRTRYDVEVDAMSLLVLHPKHGRYQTHSVPVMDSETHALMER